MVKYNNDQNDVNYTEIAYEVFTDK